MKTTEKLEPIPFRPYVDANEEVYPEGYLYIETGLVIIPPPEPIPIKEILKIDKLAFYVAKPDNLKKIYEVTGEFIGGAIGETGGSIGVYIYHNNEVSHYLEKSTVELPVEYISQIRSKMHFYDCSNDLLIYTNYLSNKKNYNLMIDWAIKKLQENTETVSIIELAGLVKHEEALAHDLFLKSLKGLSISIPTPVELVSNIIKSIDSNTPISHLENGSIVTIGAEDNNQLLSDEECPKCGLPIFYNYNYDSKFCVNCNVWLEHTCKDPECDFCADRPEKPI